MKRFRNRTPASFYILLALLLLGIFFRFVNLDEKLYWFDECGTSLRISGYTKSEAEEQLSANGGVFSPVSLQKYQYPNPEKNTIDIIRGLALQDPQNGPFYFVILRFWVKWLGNSISITRGFSAFISLLAFPCLYWLCQELFKSPTVGWVAIALVSVSPIHVVYAQEARPYSLWIVEILLSSTMLLRAIRLKTKASWIAYTVTILLGLYTQFIFALVAIGHGVYVALTERFRPTRTFISCMFALLTGFLAFVPWLLVILHSPANLETAGQSWINTKQNFLDSSTRWSGMISRFLLDLGISPSEALQFKIVLSPIIILILALTIYSVHFLYQTTPKRILLFILTLIGSTGVPFIVMDFVFEKRYGTTRYILPSLLGAQLSIAYFIDKKSINSTTCIRHIRQNKLYSIIPAAVISAGIVSCTIHSQAETWWNKVPAVFGEYPKVVRVVNQADKPLLLSDNIYELLILSHTLDSKARIKLLNNSDISALPDGFSDVFLYTDSKLLQDQLEEVYKSEFKQVYSALWKLERRT